MKSWSVKNQEVTVTIHRTVTARWRSNGYLAAAIALALYVPVNAQAWWWYLGPDANKPLNSFSFVRDDDWPVSHIVAFDAQYPSALTNLVTAGSVDVLFQQCFGGGFLDPISKCLPRSRLSNYTAAAASRFNEPSWSYDTVDFVFNPSLDDFSRAYRDAAVARHDASKGQLAGMGMLWKIATVGMYGVAKDRYAIWGDAAVPPGREHPQYLTPDEIGLEAGPNNGRSLMHGVGGNQYAILVAWNTQDNRHAVDIARMDAMLRDVYGVPSNNIVILFDRWPKGDHLGWWTKVDAQAKYNCCNDGNNLLATWQSALRGDLFTGIKPGSSDKLWIYNTGHGGSWLYDPWVYIWNFNPLLGWTTANNFNLAADGFASGFSLSDMEASTVMDTANPMPGLYGTNNGTVLLQLQLSEQINSNATITLNGMPSTNYTFGDPLLVNNITDTNTCIYDYGFTNAVTYQWTLSEDWLSITNPVILSIGNVASQYRFDPNFAVLVVSFIGGDQELAYVNQQAPNTNSPALAAASDTLYRYTNVTAKALLSRLITNANPPLGGQFQLKGLDGQSALGVPVSTDGKWVFYDAPVGFNTGPPPASDTFGLSLTDSQGNLGSLTVSVYVIPPSNHVTLNLISVSNTPPGTTLTFAGIPGLTNIVEFTDQLPATNWTQFAGPIPCGPNGKFTVVDPTGGTQRYYRTLIYWP